MSKDGVPRDPTLSRAYRQAAGGEPPPALDALILAAARQEAATPARSARAPWWRRALAPVGVFATLVVTLSVVLMIEQEHRDLLPASVPAPAPALAPAAPMPAMPEAVRPMEEEIAKSAAAKREERRAAAKPAPEPTEAPRFAPAPPSATSDQALRARDAEPSAASGAVEGRALSSEQAVAPKATAAAPAASAASAAAPSAAPSAAPPPAPSGAPAVLPAAPAQFAAPRRELKSADKLEAVKAPAVWLEEIRGLRRAGREAEAQSQLAAFRRAYPDYPLPDDLK